MNDDWQPLDVRLGLREPFGFDEGIPDHLAAPLLSIARGGFWTGRHYREGEIRWFGLKFKLAISQSPSDAVEQILSQRHLGPVQFLRIIDAQLARGIINYEVVSEVLDTGMSVWTVAEDGNSLVRRVGQTAVEALNQALEPDDEASRHLSDAWHEAYGLEPNPGDACGYATKAVEALLRPIVAPNNKVATIGSMRRYIEQNPTRFSFLVDPEDGAFLPFLNVVYYKGGRHGGDPKAPPSLEEARACVQMAVTLVEWLRSGVFSRAE